MNFIPPQDETRLRAAASGVLPNGRPVVVNADGTVSVISGDALGSQATLDSVLWEIPEVCFDSNANRFVYFYLRSNQGYAVVGQMTNTTMSFGTPVSMNSNGNIKFPKVAFDSNTNKVLFAFQDKAQSEQGTAVVGTVDPSDNSISFGSEARFTGNNGASNVGLSFDSNVNKFVISFKDSTNSGYATARTATISGTSVSFGTAAVYASEGIFGTVTLNEFDSNVNKTLLSWDDSSGQDINLKVATISGTDLSFGTGVQIITDSTNDEEMVFDTSANKFVIFYNNTTPNPDEGQALVATISGTNVSVGNVATFSTDDVGKFDVVYNPDTGSTAIVYQAPSTDYAQAIMATVSGTTVSFGSPFLLNSAAANEFAVSYDTNTNRFGVGFGISGSTVALSFGASVLNLTAENYIGMSGGAVKATGTVASIGSKVEFESGALGNEIMASVFDPDSNKVVIAYTDNGNSNYGTAVVGTVSGTSISFGTPAVFEAGTTTHVGATYDTTNNKVIIVYKDESNSNYGTAVVGTLSGTDISFGTPAVYLTAASNDNSASFDTNAGKAVIASRNDSNGDVISRVGTVSGTDISFGTAVQVDDNGHYVNTVFDSNSNKVVVLYRDLANSNYGTARVGTVSGTDISFGTEAVFASVSAPDIASDFDSTNNKVVIGFVDGTNGDVSKGVVGTVSGTDISFGTALTVNSSGGATKVIFDVASGVTVFVSTTKVNSVTVSGTSLTNLSSTFDLPTGFGQATAVMDVPSTNIVLGYRDTADSNTGNAIVLNPDDRATNRGQVADGATALIDTKGAINDNQNALTAGQSYFVQTDGTLSTTAGDPSVFAGTAVSATKLIVKG